MNILITGSTDGMGKLVAIKLAKAGHDVYLHGRNLQKLATAIAELKKETKNEHIDGFVADFSDLDAVKQMSDQTDAYNETKIKKLITTTAKILAD